MFTLLGNKEKSLCSPKEPWPHCEKLGTSYLRSLSTLSPQRKGAPSCPGLPVPSFSPEKTTLKQVRLLGRIASLGVLWPPHYVVGRCTVTPASGSPSWEASVQGFRTKEERSLGWTWGTRMKLVPCSLLPPLPTHHAYGINRVRLGYSPHAQGQDSEVAPGIGAWEH